MGIPPNMAMFTSGLGTIPYVLATRIPIYLGTSFAYIAAIALVMQQGSRAEVAGGILAAGLVSVVVGILVKLIGGKWIEKILPVAVTGHILIAIGQVLNPVAWSNAASNWPLAIATVTLIVVLALAFRQRSSITGLPLFLALVVMTVVSAVMGLMDLTQVTSQSFFILPEFVLPAFTAFGVLTIMIPTIATLAEDAADVEAIGVIFGENLKPLIWLSYIFDGIADWLSWSANPSTPYNESIGATQIAKNQRPELTREQFIPVILVAAVIAISAGFLGWVTPLIQAIPGAVTGGGLFWIVTGVISVLGPLMFVTNKVDFTATPVWATSIVATMMWLSGAAGADFSILGVSIGAIAACALIVVIGYQLIQISGWFSTPVILVAAVWMLLSGVNVAHLLWFAGLSGVITVLYYLAVRFEVDFSKRWVQIPMAVIIPLVVGLILKV
jgi:uracil permease